MANLIITIISLAIFAIVAASAIYYGGQAFENAQINATANAIMNEAQQILAAERIWSTNNGQPDISGMTAPGGMGKLVSGKELAEWPSFAGSIGLSTNLTNPGPQFNGGGGTSTTAEFDYGCYSISGYYGGLYRLPFSYNNGNYVVYKFTPGTYASCATFSNVYFVNGLTDVSQINHPIVKIAKAINAAMNQIPANADLSAMQNIGLPWAPSGSALVTETTVYDPSGYWATQAVVVDPNGIMQTNYCHLSGSSPQGASIICVFGPS